MSGGDDTPSRAEVDALLSAIREPAPGGETERVFGAVRRGLSGLPGGSGHVSAYVLERESFVVESREQLGRGRLRVAFSVSGHLLSEFDVATEDDGPARPPTRLRGSIVVEPRTGDVRALRCEPVRDR